MSAESGESFWAKLYQSSWEGDYYRHSWKQENALPLIYELNSRNELGNVLLDIGSGSHSLLDVLDTSNRKVIKVDIGASESKDKNILVLQYDIEKIGKVVYSTGRIKTAVADFLGIQNFRDASPLQIDTVLLSDILNYIDYKNVIGNITPFVKIGGRLIIFNSTNEAPIEHGEQYLSAKRPQSGREILAFLDEQGYTAETAKHSGRPKSFGEKVKNIFNPGEPEIIVARKLSPERISHTRFG